MANNDNITLMDMGTVCSNDNQYGEEQCGCHWPGQDPKQKSNKASGSLGKKSRV